MKQLSMDQEVQAMVAKMLRQTAAKLPVELRQRLERGEISPLVAICSLPEMASMAGALNELAGALETGTLVIADPAEVPA